MKQRTARLLRRLANRLDPQAQPPQFYVTYNGQPVDMEGAVLTAITKLQRMRRLA